MAKGQLPYYKAKPVDDFLEMKLASKFANQKNQITNNRKANLESINNSSNRANQPREAKNSPSYIRLLKKADILMKCILNTDLYIP